MRFVKVAMVAGNVENDGGASGAKGGGKEMDMGLKKR